MKFNSFSFTSPRVKRALPKRQSLIPLSYTAAARRKRLIFASSALAERLPHDEEGLEIMLQRALREAKLAGIRSRWFGGRIYNHFAGTDPDYIEVSGTHLKQILRKADFTLPGLIENQELYLVRVDIADDALRQTQKISSSRKIETSTDAKVNECLKLLT